MKSKTLWLIAGVPGSGKSTFLANKVNSSKAKIVSRDAIRFKLLGDGDSYFKNEDTV
jgi:predicted ABC-type ATPase